MIFATDVDGTILTDEGTPHKETNDAFKYARSKENYIVIATGRSLSRTKILLKLMPDIDFFVCNNGSLVYDVKNKKIIYLRIITPKNYLTVLKFAKENNFSLTIHTNLNTYTWPKKRFENNFPINDEFNLKFNDFINKNPKSEIIFNGEQITQLSLLGSEENCVNNFPNIKKLFLNKQNIFLTNAIFIDINPLNVSKWTGLKFLAQYLNINSKYIVTFGDSGNDFEMLKNAKEYGFPMKNSTSDLIELLKPKIGTNNTNAIAKKIIELIDKNK